MCVGIRTWIFSMLRDVGGSRNKDVTVHCVISNIKIHYD